MSKRTVLSATIWLLLCATAAQAEPRGRLTEAGVVAEAVAKNPGLRAALAEVRSAEAAEAQAQAQYPFMLGADAGYTRAATPNLGQRGVTVSDSDSVDAGVQVGKHFVLGTEMSLRLDGSWQLSHQPSFLQPGSLTRLGPAYGVGARFTVSQPLIRGAGEEVNLAQLAAARAQLTAADRTRERVASEVLRDVLSAYWQLWYTGAAVEIQQQSLDLARAQRDQAVARSQTGSLAPADVLTFDTQVATREEQLVQAEADRSQSATELARIVGSAGGPSPGLPAESSPPQPAQPRSDAAELALAASAEVREAEAAVEIAEIKARTAGESYRPRLDVDAYVEARGLGERSFDPAFRQATGLDAASAHVGITFEMPIGDAQRSAAVTQALASVEAARDRLEATRQAVLANLQSQVTRQAAARRRLNLALATTRTAEARLAAQRARFETGSSTPLEVLQAEDDVRTARLRAARARVDLAEACVVIDHLTGELLRRHDVRVGASASAPRVASRLAPGAF
jgi:outer membrane protein